MIRDTRAAYRRRAAATERSIDAALAEVEAAEEAERQAAIARYRERMKPVPFTREQLDAARIARVGSKWYVIAKVNAKSVTVLTPFSWKDSYPIDKILEVKP